MAGGKSIGAGVLKLCLIATSTAVLVILGSAAALTAPQAILTPGNYTLASGETGTFAIKSDADRPSDFTAWCEVEGSGGIVTLMFDAERYIPLSNPTVGEMITLRAGEKRRWKVTGSIDPNPGDAYIGFIFTGTTTSFCFPGMDCSSGGTTAGTSATVSCGQN